MNAKSLVLISALLFLGLAPLGSLPARADSGEIQVSTLPWATHSRPAVAVFPDGGFVVVWTASPARGRLGEIHARFFDRDGNPTTDEFRLLDPTAGSQTLPQVAADSDGSFLLAWTEIAPGNFLGNVFVQRFRRDGAPQGNRIQLNRPGVEGQAPVLTIGPDRRFGVAWQSFSTAEEALPLIAAARTFTAAGVPLSGEIRIAHPALVHSSPQSAAFGRNGTLLVLLEGYNANFTDQLWLARVTTGSTSPSLVQVAAFTLGHGAALARLRNGSFVTAWYSFELRARRLAPTGAPRGDSFKPVEAFDVVWPRLAPLANGGYVLVWSEWVADDGYPTYNVFGRPFAADGTPLAATLQIDATVRGHEFGTGVATWPGGPVVAVWQAQSEGRVYARVLPFANP